MLRAIISIVLATCTTTGCWLSHGDDDDGSPDGDADADGDADPCSDSPASVDLLVMVDDNGAMAQEQAMFTEEIGVVVEGLTSAAVGVESLHLGVISSDMGTGGFAVQTCADAVEGDDGILQHLPSDDVAGCASEYPSYLTWVPGDDPAQVTRDFACIGSLGTGGCGFQQQLKAVDNALTHHSAPGQANEGFLRDDSLLAILLLTNEDDCSVREDDPQATDIFNTQLDLGPLNLRCYQHPEYVEPVESFVRDLLALRPCPADLAVFGIVGIPPGAQGECNLSDMTAADFECVLNLPEMQEVVDNSAEGKGERLTPSCDEAGLGEAFPPRRIVETIRQLALDGAGAGVGSLCEPGFGRAMDRMLQELLARLDD